MLHTLAMERFSRKAMDSPDKFRSILNTFSCCKKWNIPPLYPGNDRNGISGNTIFIFVSKSFKIFDDSLKRSMI